MRPARLRLPAVAVVAALAVAAAGCGEEKAGERAETTAPAPSAPEAKPAGFPAARGRSFADIRGEREQEVVLAPAVSGLEPGGRRRFAFGLFTPGREPVADGEVAVYLGDRRGRRAQGPFPARRESLEVPARFRSKITEADDHDAPVVYVADLPARAPGDVAVMALVRRDGRTIATSAHGVKVADTGPPSVGERSVRVHTPTAEDVDGDLSRIDTRVPPSSMHEHDLADVLGRRPVVLVFATPALCQTQVCGPVVDIAEQVKAEHGDRAAFIHMEIYEENRPDRGFRPQVRAWRLPSEPWAFAIDREGRVAARLEGAFSARELQAAVRKIL